MPQKNIILVDKQDKQIGASEKMAAHKAGKLHRCFSIFVFNSKGEWLLQQRAKVKYHSPGLWTNSCCSHPRPGKNIKLEAEKRLKEEFGFSTPLKEVFVFHYKAKLNTPNHKVKLTENEIDHVFIGKFNGTPKPNPAEIGDWRWVNPDDVKTDLKANPQRYTPWFKKVFPRVLNLTKANKNKQK